MPARIDDAVKRGKMVVDKTANSYLKIVPEQSR